MKRRSFIAAALTASLVAPGAPVFAQNAALLDRISSYLENIQTAESAFVQTNSDGSRSTGTVMIDRPGLMRFEYDAPVPAVVIADGVWVAVVDRASNARPQRYPIGSTPLNLILREDVDFAGEGVIDRVERLDDEILVTARDPGNARAGTLTMIFRDDPLELVEWVTLNEAGQRTAIRLEGLETGMAHERRLFSIEWEVLQRG